MALSPGPVSTLASCSDLFPPHPEPVDPVKIACLAPLVALR